MRAEHRPTGAECGACPECGMRTTDPAVLDLRPGWLYGHPVLDMRGECPECEETLVPVVDGQMQLQSHVDESAWERRQLGG